MRLVHVRWADPTGCGGEWRPIFLAQDEEALTCYTAGWLIGNHKDRVVIAGSIDKRAIGNPHASDCTVIPRRCILKLTTLKEPK